MMKKFTLFLLLASMMIPMTLSAQREKREALADGVMLDGSRSLLRKNVTASANTKVQKITPSVMGGKSLRRAMPRRASD